MMFHKILVAIEDAETSPIVFEQAVSLARTNQAELLILHVLPPFEWADYSTPYAVGMSQVAIEGYLKHWQEQEQLGLKNLRSLEEKAIAAGISAECTQCMGDPGKVICTLAKTWSADLIVVGRRGLGGFSEFLLGSVSSYVLHHAACDVLTIQGEVQNPSRTETVTTTSPA